MSKNVVIVGNGLFGSIAATLARQRGANVIVISNLEHYAASKASGCVLAPSWLTSLDASQVEVGMNVLRALYSVHDVTFTTNVLATFRAQRVDPDEVLVRPDVVGDVESVGNGRVTLANGDVYEGLVLVAAGVWCERLVAMPKMRGLFGASARFTAHLPTPKIHAYAPYKQAVAFQLNRKEVWVGDGTAVIFKTWDAEKEARVNLLLERGGRLIAPPGIKYKTKVTVGARPYVDGHRAGYFDRVHPRTWISTGGSKNGTVLAAAQAARFVEEARL